MNKLTLAITVIGALLAIRGLSNLYKSEQNISEVLLKHTFEAFKETHKKVYSSYAEEQYRIGVFSENMKTVERLNKIDPEVTLGASFFADLTNEEFKNRYLGLKPKPAEKSEEKYLTWGDAPKSLDWRESGAVTKVRNQGGCGSCWAISAAGSIESAYFLKTKKLQDVSVQQMVDCSKEEGDQGCNGGYMTGAFEYVEKNGLEKEDDYKYTGKDGTCGADKTKAISDLTVKSHTKVPKADSDQLKAFLLKQPVAIGLDANIVQFYMFGVINYLPCSTEINHGVLLVGYDVSWFGTPYWLVKNSWGSWWGESGYFKIRRDSGKGVGKCGLTEQASVPNL